MDFHQFIESRIEISSPTAISVNTMDGPPTPSSRILSNKSLSLSVKGKDFPIFGLLGQLFTRIGRVHPKLNMSLPCIAVYINYLLHSFWCKNNVLFVIPAQKVFEGAHVFLLPRACGLFIFVSPSSRWLLQFQFQKRFFWCKAPIC